MPDGSPPSAGGEAGTGARAGIGGVGLVTRRAFTGRFAIRSYALRRARFAPARRSLDRDGRDRGEGVSSSGGSGPRRWNSTARIVAASP